MRGDGKKPFLDLYFRSVYNKLEADALLFNRRLPHEALKGSENERAIADVLREFLPSRYGVECNALVIDRHGNASRQCDIVIFDDVRFPKYFRKVYPVEMVYAVIEVKTEVTKQRVDESLQNEAALRSLAFYPALTRYWETQTVERKLPHAPPVHCIFGYRSSTIDFGTFVTWFSRLPTGTGSSVAPFHPPFNHFVACALDKGIISCRGDGRISRWLTVASERDNERTFPVVADGEDLRVDPSKALFLFLETLWTMLEQSPRHPGFDIRSYMEDELGTVVPFDHGGKFGS